MKQFESGWQNAEGITFYVRGWEPDRPAKAAVALVHGLGDHTGRYAHVGKAFTDAGYALTGFDLRGHGRSSGPRGHTPSYERLLDDLSDFMTHVLRRYPKKLIFLYGHSLGGNIVLNFVLRRKPKLKGVIVTSPWIELRHPLPKATMAFAEVASRILPGLPNKSGLKPTDFSHDRRVVEAYLHDPLAHDSVTPRFFVGAYEAGLWAGQHATDFPLPLLLMHGSGDNIVSFAATRKFAGEAGKKVTWREWEGGYHELHNEPEGPQVLKVMTRWMDGRLRKP